MIKLSLRDDSQKFFKALIGGWCFVWMLAVSYAQAAEEAQLCVDCKREPPAISDQNLESITDLKQVLSLDSQQNCFYQLTRDDRDFLEKLFNKLSEHCGVHVSAMTPLPMAPFKRLPASDNSIDQQLEKVSPQCAESAQSMLFKEIENYGKNFGTAAKKRVSTVMLAQLQGLQIANILRDFEDPALAPSFQKFTEAVYNYDQSLKRVMHQDLNDIQSDSPGLKSSILSRLTQKSSTVAWLYQRGSMIKDGFLTKANLSDKTRFQEHTKAAEKLLFSGIDLNKKIQSSHFSAEKKSNLIQQVNLLNNSMRGRYNQSQNTLNEEEQVAKIATGGFASVVLIAASLGTLSPSFLWAGRAADFLSNSVSMATSSVMGAAGVSGTVEVSAMILGSRAAAKDNVSRFLCELAKKMNEEGQQALERVLGAAGVAGQIGAVAGGGAYLLSRHSRIREYQILMGVLGAFIGLNVIDVKNKLEKAEDHTGEKAHARLQYEAGSIRYGELVDKIGEVNQKDAYNNAELIGRGINISRLIYFTKDVGSSIATEKVINETLLKTLKNLEHQNGRTFTRTQYNAAMTFLNLRVKSHEKVKKFSKQEKKAIDDLKSAGFAPSEIQGIVNVNITTIIPNSNSNVKSSF